MQGNFRFLAKSCADSTITTYEQNHGINRVSRKTVSLQNYKERIVHISLSKRHFIAIVSAQATSCRLVDRHLKCTVQRHHIEKQLQSGVVVGFNKKIHTAYKKLYF